MFKKRDVQILRTLDFSASVLRRSKTLPQSLGTFFTSYPVSQNLIIEGLWNELPEAKMVFYQKKKVLTELRFFGLWVAFLGF